MFESIKSNAQRMKEQADQKLEKIFVNNKLKNTKLKKDSKPYRFPESKEQFSAGYFI